MTKNSLKGKYHLLFKLIHNAFFQRIVKRTIVTNPDLFLMEALEKFKNLTLPIIIIKHILKVMTTKDVNYGLVYGFLSTKMFSYFDVEYILEKEGSVNKCLHC